MAKKPYYALCQMPLPVGQDDVLYNDKDGRELDERADSFALSCLRSLKESGFYNYFSEKTVLDVGCGRGILLSLLPASLKIGVDPQPAAKINAVNNVKIVTGTMKDVQGQFDIVMSWHVLEHVDNPPAFVQDMASHAKMGGLVIIATPNTNSIMAKFKNWRCLEPFHKYLLGRQLLKSLMINSGLKIEYTATWGGFPAPRSFIKELANQLLKLFGHGDVQLVIARKTKDI